LTDVAAPAAATAPTSFVDHPEGSDRASAAPAVRTSAKHETTNERTLSLVT
jgi:hypothetical protein